MINILDLRASMVSVDFRTGHSGASFEILVVSDIPFDCYTKLKYIYKSLDSNIEFVKKLKNRRNLL